MRCKKIVPNIKDKASVAFKKKESCFNKKAKSTIERIQQLPQKHGT